MPVEREQRSPDGLSRRQLLTRGAIAGGLVWAAPIIRSTAAYATTANGTEKPCTNFFMVMIDPNGKARGKPGDMNDKRIPPAIRDWFASNPDVDVQFPIERPMLTQASNDAWAILLPEVAGPNAAGRQCRMVLGWASKDKKFSEGYVDPNPPLAIEVGRRLLFPCPPRSDRGDGSNQSASASADAAESSSDSLSASGAPESQISSDGSSSGNTINSDGRPSQPVTSDGTPSTSRPFDPNACIDTVFLIYCCPR